MSLKTKPSRYVPGMTFRAVLASILCMMLAAIYTNYTAVILGESYTISESAIPIPAMLVLIGLTIFVGLFALIFRLRLLTKAEMICVAFATMMAVPMMTQGFWHRFLCMLSATPRNRSFDYSDAVEDSLWPHGRDLFAGSLTAARTGKADDNVLTPSTGNFSNIVWCVQEVEEGVLQSVAVISNTTATSETYISYDIKVNPNDPNSPNPAEPHLITCLFKGENAEGEAEIFCDAIADDNPVPEHLFKESPRSKLTYLHKKGYVRLGEYGIIPARVCNSNLTVRIGLRKRGVLTIADPRFFSVAALETIYRGRKIVNEDEWNAMAPEDRPAGAVIKPNNLWSLKGIAYYFNSHIPFGDWARPFLIWGSYVFMLLTALFCMNVIMRKKWAESERYPMPNTRIPLAITGAEDKEDSPFSGIWKNRFAWAGLLFAIVYGGIKGWRAFNPHMPDFNICIHLGEYVTNPIFGGMFNVDFIFSLFVCSIAIFFELNILMSIIVGYWVCRSAYFLGHVTGIDVNNGFPWFQEQAAGSYIGYFVIVIALSSKYLWGILKDAFKGKAAEEGDVFSPRVAVILFILCHIGVALWSGLTGASVVAMAIMFSFLVMCGFVGAKYRAECGNPFGYFTPYNIMLVIGVLGGVKVFGARGMMISLLLSGFLTVTVFFLIPGMQFEILQIGKKLKIQPRHIIYTCLLGLFGGLFIGGWAFLSNGYAAGAESFRDSRFYNGYVWFITRIRAPLTEATAMMQQQNTGITIKPVDWGRRAMIFSGVIMAILTVLRQYLAGFWFHPVGFMIGFTFQNDGANWGTLLIAWLIRYIVLKIGGARAVRTKLQPFFIGAFVGCVLTVGLFSIINGIAVSHGSPCFYDSIP